MATYKIRSDQLGPLTLCEDNEIRAVLQNVQMIIGTRRGTVPMYRDFGISMDFIDRPAPAAETILAAEVREALEKYEPRANLKSVAAEYDADGEMYAVLEVEI